LAYHTLQPKIHYAHIHIFSHRFRLLADGSMEDSLDLTICSFAKDSMTRLYKKLPTLFLYSIKKLWAIDILVVLDQLISP